MGVGEGETVSVGVMSPGESGTTGVGVRVKVGSGALVGVNVGVGVAVGSGALVGVEVGVGVTSTVGVHITTDVIRPRLASKGHTLLLLMFIERSPFIQ